jgi:hypothetical protein
MSTETVAGVENQNTTLRIDRLDGERLVLDGLGLAHGFFLGDPSSIGTGSYDSLAGRGERDRITTADIQAINRTMRARSNHQWWEPVLNRELDCCQRHLRTAVPTVSLHACAGHLCRAPGAKVIDLLYNWTP